MTEADIVKLHEVWPEGHRDHGLMLHQAPGPIMVVLARHPWDSVTLRETMEAEQRLRKAYHETRGTT